MHILLGILIYIISLLGFRRYLLPQVLIGRGHGAGLKGPFFTTKVFAEHGYKRLHHNSAFPLVGIALAMWFIYLYVWRDFILRWIRAYLQVLEMPLGLKETLFAVDSLQLAAAALVVGLAFLLWTRFRVSHKRRLYMGRRGLSIDGNILFWSELKDLTLDSQRISFKVKDRSHFYSWQVGPKDLEGIKAALAQVQSPTG